MTARGVVLGRRPTSQVLFALHHRGIGEEKPQAFVAQARQIWDIAARREQLVGVKYGRAVLLLQTLFAGRPAAALEGALRQGRGDVAVSMASLHDSGADGAAVASLDDVYVVRRVAGGGS